jgi:hypothetical protein
LGKDPIGLGQMLDGEGAVSLAFIEKAEDHFSPFKTAKTPNAGSNSISS